MNYLIKCLACGTIHEHSKPLPYKDISEYLCKECKVVGQAKILRGGVGMFGG